MMNGFQNKEKQEKINFSDLNIAQLTSKEILSYLENRITEREKTFCVTINLDILRLAYENPEYFNILRNSDFIMADGAPIIWLSQMINKPIPERTAGADIVYDFCKLSNEKGYKIFMLGAGANVADRAKSKLEETMPNIKIVGTYSPTHDEITNEQTSKNIVEMINSSQADILFVALGAPKQETWVSKYYDSLNPYVIIPCGGSIDFIAETQKRAGKLWGKLGIEWVHRFIHNPKRLFERYFIHDIPFLLKLVLRIKLNAKK